MGIIFFDIRTNIRIFHNSSKNHPPSIMAKTTNYGPVTVYLDKNLWVVFQQFCAKNPKAKSPSNEITKMLRSVVAKKGGKYGLRVPAAVA